MILVPDLRGLTEDQVISSLGDLLVLANPTGDDGRVRRQSPPPGTLVEPASAVTVVLDGPPAASRLPLLLLGLFVTAAVAGMVAANHVRRRRSREKRWLDEQVRTDLQPQKAVLSVVPEHAVPGIDLRLEVHRNPARL
jgi:PASTA domain